MSDLTELRHVRTGAYGVEVDLDDHVEILSTSLLVCEWDQDGDRLLYERQVLRWQTLRGTGEVWAPEGAPQPYRLEVEIAQLPRAAGTLSSAAQGTRFALVDQRLLEAPPESLPLQVTCIAADPETGAVAVFWRREPQNGSGIAPYRTTARLFSRLGLPASSVVNWLDNEGDLSWYVCSAAWGPGGSLYVVQANDTNAGRSLGRVVRHNPLGTWADVFDTSDAAVNPVAVAVGGGSVWVLVAALIHPLSGPNYYEWSLGRLGPSLNVLDYHRVDFGLDGDPIWTFAWPGSSAPQYGGGNLLYDAGSLISSGYSPNGWPGDEGPTEATFRWSAGGTGTWIEDLGPAVPHPLHRSGAAELVGSVQFQPPSRVAWGE
jgi:hypothetical protein